MTSRFTLLAGLVYGLVATSGVAQAKVLEHIVFHSDTSVVSFDSSTPLDCGGGVSGALTTRVTVNGFEFTNRSTSAGTVRSNTAVVSLSQDNSCTGEFVFGIGNADGAFAQDVLKTATFQGTVALSDFSGVPVGTVVMNLTLTGTGPVTQNNQHFRFSVSTPTGPAVTTIHSNGRSVDGVLSGSFSFNGGNVPLPSPEFVFSEIAVSKSGTMQLVKSQK